ncbi:MAG: hypothetical protein GY832_23550 [Chloroflexi bacterium]|nr:hypothetical protein [Chloroflexota bacterium]
MDDYKYNGGFSCSTCGLFVCAHVERRIIKLEADRKQLSDELNRTIVLNETIKPEKAKAWFHEHSYSTDDDGVIVEFSADHEDLCELYRILYGTTH